MNGDVRLYISVASCRDWKPKFAQSLAALTHHLTANGIKGHNLTNYFLRSWGNGSCLSILRQAFVDEMIADGFTHWLSLDDDMTFPMDIVDRLIAHDRDVVSCNARYKTEEIKGSCQGMDGKPINTNGKTGIEELKTMGGAIFLARVEVFKDIPKPHFQVLWSPVHQNYVGEDVHFATLLRINGVKLWADHDVSRDITHIGEKEFGWEQVSGINLVEAAE